MKAKRKKYHWHRKHYILSQFFLHRKITIHYCPACPWRWNARFEELNFNNNCNCNFTHTCYDLHEKEEIKMTYSTKL